MVLDSEDETDEDTKKPKKRVRGWFPANCAEELKLEEEDGQEVDERSNSHANSKVKSKDD